jgi:anti-sigma28 factor (negative regulator of flagellin synthesis)
MGKVMSFEQQVQGNQAEKSMISDSQLVSAVLAGIKATPDREDKIEAARARLQNGAGDVSAREIAEAFLAELA